MPGRDAGLRARLVEHGRDGVRYRGPRATHQRPDRALGYSDDPAEAEAAATLAIRGKSLRV